MYYFRYRQEVKWPCKVSIKTGKQSHLFRFPPSSCKCNHKIRGSIQVTSTWFLQHYRVFAVQARSRCRFQADLSASCDQNKGKTRLPPSWPFSMVCKCAFLGPFDQCTHTHTPLPNCNLQRCGNISPTLRKISLLSNPIYVPKQRTQYIGSEGNLPKAACVQPQDGDKAPQAPLPERRGPSASILKCINSPCPLKWQCFKYVQT